jgi:predicted aspartyl protease
MPEVLIPAELKGEKGKVKTIMLANTGSDLVILTEKVAREIEPTFMGHTIDLEVGGGATIKGQACVVEISVKDPETGESRSEVVEAVVVKGQRELLMGISALERLGVLLNLKEGKFQLI